VARQVLLDRDQVFSSEHGWGVFIGRLFSRGLMLRDFDEHRYHRRIMQDAFRAEAMRGYLERMPAIIERSLSGWRAGAHPDLYAAFKQLTLDITSEIFVGVRLGPEADRVNRAFVDAVAAGVATIRAPLPGTAYRRGMAGRRFLERWFGERIPERRASGATDLFTRLCHATDEDGASFTDEEIVDHMIFLLMAAHDTTTSTLGTMAWAMARHPGWQDRMREEILDLGGPVTWEERDRLPVTDLVFKEAMRLHPPVPFIPRRTTGPTGIGRYPIPEGTLVGLAVYLIHRRPDLWTDPERFDPDRFSAERAEHRNHSHGYIPFGGGAHMCIGMHFAEVMTKAIMAGLLPRLRLVADGGDVTFRISPIPKPRGGLPMRLEPVESR
jgi:cytochrome P450